MFSQRRFHVNHLSLSRYPAYTNPFGMSFPWQQCLNSVRTTCPNISSQSRPVAHRSHLCSFPAERKKDGGKLGYDACADSY